MCVPARVLSGEGSNPVVPERSKIGEASVKARSERPSWNGPPRAHEERITPVPLPCAGQQPVSWVGTGRLRTFGDAPRPRAGTRQQQEAFGSGSRGEACRRGRSGQGSGEEGEGPWRCWPAAAGGGGGQVGLVWGSRCRAEREKRRRGRREAGVRGEGQAGARSGARGGRRRGAVGAGGGACAGRARGARVRAVGRRAA